MLLDIRAKGGGWDFKTTRSSVLVVVIGDNSKQYSRSAVGCLPADERVLQIWSENVRLTDARTSGRQTDGWLTDGGMCCYCLRLTITSW
jgi:hypothetical protein